MKRLSFLVPCSLALCSLTMATHAFAQELPQPIEETVVAQPALLDQWRERTMTVEEAWRKELLDEKSAMTLLEGGAIAADTDEDRQMRVALVSLLMKHAPQSLQPVNTLDLRLKKALAEYYASVKDDRAIGLYEELLARDEFGSYAKGLLFKALGGFYSVKHQDEKAVAVFLRAQVMLAAAKQTRFAAEMLVYMAISYKMLGQEQKAWEIYARVAASGDDWMHGLALEDQAFFAYQAGDFTSSRKYAQEAITKFDLVAGSIGVDGYKFKAEKLIDYSTKWDKEPIDCQPREIRINGVNESLTGTVTKRFKIHTQRTVPLSIACDQPQITVRLDEKSLPDDRDYLRYYSQREAIVEIPADVLRRGVDATITVSSSRWPEFQARVPIHVEAQPALRVLPAKLFFGFVKAGQTTSKSLKLNAGKPFKIVKVESDNTLLQASVDALAPAAMENTVELKLIPTNISKVYEGKIRVLTDLPDQEVMEVPYYAYAE